MRIRSKILIPIVIVALVCSVTIGLLGIYVVNTFVNDFELERLQEASDLTASLLKQRAEEATRLSGMLAKEEDLIYDLKMFHSIGTTTMVLNNITDKLASIGVDFITIVDANGVVVGRAHEPENFGDSLYSQENIHNALSGTQYATIETGSAVRISVRCGTPIYDSNGALIGAVSLGYRLDTNSLVDNVSELSGMDCALFLGSEAIATNLRTGTGGMDLSLTVADGIRNAVMAGENYTGRVTILGKPRYAHYSPLLNANGDAIGIISLALDTGEWDARMSQDTLIMIFTVLGLSVIASVVGIAVSNRLSRPITNMSVAANRLAEGDVDVELHVTDAATKDETVLLERAFSNMILANRERANLISAVAEGDLRGSISPRSDKDVVALSLFALLERQNTAFRDMIDSTTQIDSAALQIANGAQNLSHGATEQASTVDRLLGSLRALSNQTADKAKQAQQAAQLSESVRTLAQSGNVQMSQMLEAVQQISGASEAIGRVIKVIDDIAFQTNILALNASVEAARAGQHGKGFAVVAEEVRRLASKSTEAAKNTGELIANSMEKARLGAKISTDTAASFTSIVEGINESTTIVAQIAEFMQSQNSEIDSITHGVDRISDVIASISASAEESAASSEEMSAQTSSIAAKLAEYRLRDDIPRLGQRNP
ncbi:MAG: methyl-accepting chemotaxis protein [Oscillospiraceae bacterium]|nr:methyl-accepting chemotaxis protein [Oscillospiraceae bacterium]